MSQDQEQTGRRPDQLRGAGAPWPLVERRAEPRELEPSPLLRLPRQHCEPTAGTVVRRVLPVDDVPSARQQAPVLLGDLLGVVLLTVMTALADRATVALAVVWCLLLVITEVTGPAEALPGPRRVLTAGAALVLSAATAAYAADLQLPRALVLGALPVAVLLSAAGRSVPRAGTRASRRILLVGNPESVVPTRALLLREGGPDVTVVGICCPSPSAAPASIGGVPVVGDLEELAPTVWRGGVDLVVVCSAAETSGPVLRKILWDLEGSGAPVFVAPGVVELGPGRVRLASVAGLPLLRIHDRAHTGPGRWCKHAFDRCAAGAGLVLLAPLLVVIGLLVRLTSPGPALFRQERVGQDGRAFTLVKFRSMHLDAEERWHRFRSANKHADGPLFKVEDDPRVTTFGRLLRRSSLDELPQLLNVLRGDMSLVGPRPPLPREAQTYCDAVPRRLMVRPGLTGLWQVSGRADLSWDESARLDLYYVENWSWRLDLSILCRTVGAVSRGRGAY